MEINTYLTEDEYEQVKGINLKLELAGSTDHDEKAPQQLIYNTERKMIKYLERNYAFCERDITITEENLKDFKLAVCEQVEYRLKNGDEEETPICNGARTFIEDKFMLWRSL